MAESRVLEELARIDMQRAMSHPMLPDLKYFSLIYGRQINKDRLLKLRSKCLQEVMATFYNNLARTDSFSAFPAVVAFEAVRDQFWRDCAVWKVTEKLSTRKRKFNQKTEKAIQTEIQRLYKNERNRWFAGKSDIQSRVKMGANRIESMARHELGAYQSIQALLFSVVIESWMAFEILVGDLFFEALDYGPSQWRINVAQKYTEFRRGSNWEPQKVAPTIVMIRKKNMDHL